jgi:hypothetical protein
VGNAVKFTPPRDGWEVGARSVRKDGVEGRGDLGEGKGWASRKRHSPYLRQVYQAENSSTRTISGTGLGLSITQKIVEAHAARSRRRAPRARKRLPSVSFPNSSRAKRGRLYETPTWVWVTAALGILFASLAMAGSAQMMLSPSTGHSTSGSHKRIVIARFVAQAFGAGRNVGRVRRLGFCRSRPHYVSWECGGRSSTLSGGVGPRGVVPSPRVVNSLSSLSILGLPLVAGSLFWLVVVLGLADGLLMIAVSSYKRRFEPNTQNNPRRGVAGTRQRPTTSSLSRQSDLGQNSPRCHASTKRPCPVVRSGSPNEGALSEPGPRGEARARRDPP